MDIEILILGGGPAGLSTALHLRKNFPHLSPEILVLEKSHYPRVKLCAGGLTADAEVILRGLGLDVSEIPHVNATEAHFDFEGKGLRISLPKRHTLRVIRRVEFDAWLAAKARDAGIHIREGVTVRDVQPGEDFVSVTTNEGEYRARVVVGADGSNGVTRRCVLPAAPVRTARVLEVLTPASADSQDGEPSLAQMTKTAHNNNSAYFDFFPVPEGIAGYVWDFPTLVSGRPMRCWGVYDTNLLASMKRPPLKDPLRQEMSRFGFDLDRYELKGHPIRWFSPGDQFAVPRVLLVGDAAGADPVFGEGISMALGYGALAAQEIGASFQGRDFSFTGYRRRLILSSLGQTLVARWFIANVVYTFKWRWFQILLWRILKPVVLAVSWVFVLNWAKRMR